MPDPTRQLHSEINIHPLTWIGSSRLGHHIMIPRAERLMSAVVGVDRPSLLIGVSRPGAQRVNSGALRAGICARKCAHRYVTRARSKKENYRRGHPQNSAHECRSSGHCRRCRMSSNDFTNSRRARPLFARCVRMVANGLASAMVPAPALPSPGVRRGRHTVAAREQLPLFAAEQQDLSAGDGANDSDEQT